MGGFWRDFFFVRLSMMKHVYIVQLIVGPWQPYVPQRGVLVQKHVDLLLQTPAAHIEFKG